MGAHGTNKQQAMCSTHRDIWWPAWAHQQDRDTGNILIHPSPIQLALELLRAVFSPHCFSPCTPTTAHLDPSVKLLKFADDTTLIGLIQHSDESAYRQEVKELSVWCSLNNLELNMLKPVEIILDFRRNSLLSPSHHHEQHWECSGDIQAVLNL